VVAVEVARIKGSDESSNHTKHLRRLQENVCCQRKHWICDQIYILRDWCCRTTCQGPSQKLGIMTPAQVLLQLASCLTLTLRCIVYKALALLRKTHLSDDCFVGIKQVSTLKRHSCHRSIHQRRPHHHKTTIRRRSRHKRMHRSLRLFLSSPLRTACRCFLDIRSQMVLLS
jgi:hypothetical protein